MMVKVSTPSNGYKEMSRQRSTDSHARSDVEELNFLMKGAMCRLCSKEVGHCQM